jgi:pyruvate/2-oxoglutarate dehydrogenase complex dihydrolipoamide dehydrogenase (E3) component
MDKYKAIVIGSGQGGTPLSKKLAKAGWKTAIVEKEFIGGTCVNVGCTPTKTMIACARTAWLVNNAARFGVNASRATVDLPKIVSIKNDVVDKFRSGSEKGLEKTENLTVIHGRATFSGAKNLKVTTLEGTELELEGEYIFIDTGAHSAIPDIDGLNDVNYLDSSSILDLEEIPEHLVIVGGNYIALEFGQMFRRFGSKVTILEKSARLLKREDEDIAKEMTKILKDEGIEFLFDTKPEKITKSNTGFDLTTSNNTSISGSHLLIAAGRTPNTADLNLSIPGVETDEKGYVKVNEKLETTAPGIYAVGDVKGGPAFTHISYNDYIILVANLLEGENRSITGRQVPYCVFTDPQLARVGMNVSEAVEAGIKFRVATLPMPRVARAIETLETRGLMKAIVEEETGELLGAAIIGTEAGETMTILQMAMLGKIKAPQLREMIFAHPLYAESINNLFMTLE